MSAQAKAAVGTLLEYWREVDSPFSAEVIDEGEALLALTLPLSDEQLDVYLDRLFGPEGCDFKEDGEATWTCKGGTDKSSSQAILEDMGLDAEQVELVHRYVDYLGGHCDCEILLNAAPRMELA